MFGSPPPAQTQSQAVTCVENGDEQSVQEPEPSQGFCGRSTQRGSTSHFHVENEKEVEFQDYFIVSLPVFACVSTAGYPILW